MIKRIIFKRKNNYILKYSLFLLLFIIILYLISFYYFNNREYFVIPKFTDKYFVIPTNKEGEVVDYLDKKSLNNIDNEIQDFDFKNIDELDFTIQLYSNDNFENINKYLNNLLENKKAKSKQNQGQLIVNRAKWKNAQLWCKNKGFRFRIINEKDIFHGTR